MSNMKQCKRQCQLCGSPTATKAIAFTDSYRKLLWVCEEHKDYAYSELSKIQVNQEFELAIVDASPQKE